MSKIKEMFASVIIGITIAGITMGISENHVSYCDVKRDIREAEKYKGKVYTKYYCEGILKDSSYKNSAFSRIFYGGDDAAREYLKEYLKSPPLIKK